MSTAFSSETAKHISPPQAKRGKRSRIADSENADWRAYHIILERTLASVVRLLSSSSIASKIMIGNQNTSMAISSMPQQHLVLRARSWKISRRVPGTLSPRIRLPCIFSQTSDAALDHLDWACRGERSHDADPCEHRRPAFLHCLPFRCVVLALWQHCCDVAGIAQSDELAPALRSDHRKAARCRGLTLPALSGETGV